MFRSDQLIREETIVLDVKQRFPEKVPVFQWYGCPPGDPYDIESPMRKPVLKAAAWWTPSTGPLSEARPNSQQHTSNESLQSEA